MPLKSYCLRAASIAALASAGSFVASAETQDFERQITFGDSLSDGGRYAAFTPPGTGKFTTNPDPIWVEVLADEFGLESSSIAVGGLNYAEGGARVSTPQPPGAFTQLEISSQIDNFFASGGTLGANDIVTIQGGGNDLFALQANVATLDEFFQAATDLAAQTQRLVDAGAGTVVVANLQLTDPFNQVFEAALAEQGTNALFLDVDALYNEILADPATYGFVNVTDGACTNGSSLTCTPDDLITPDANLTYALADDVHPGGRLQEIQGQFAAHHVRAPMQIGQLSYVAENVLFSTQDLANSKIRDGGDTDDGLQFFGSIAFSNMEIDGGVQRAGLSQDSVMFSAGVDRQISDKTGIGAMLTYIDGEGDFDNVAGDFENEGFIGTAYFRRQSGDTRIGAQASIGELRFNDITRAVMLGEALRINSGDTQAEIFSVGAEIAYDAAHEAFFIGPVAGAAYTDITLGAYSDGVDSTGVRFEDSDLDTVRAFAGLEVSGSGAGSLTPYLRAVYSIDIIDDDREITVTPSGAPISFTTDALTLDSAFFDIRAGLGFALNDRVNVDISAGGVVDRDDLDAYDANITVSLPF